MDVDPSTVERLGVAGIAVALLITGIIWLTHQLTHERDRTAKLIRGERERASAEVERIRQHALTLDAEVERLHATLDEERALRHELTERLIATVERTVPVLERVAWERERER